MKPSPETIESRLEEIDPSIELLALEQFGRAGLRVVIDHPEGVTLELCSKATGGLSELAEDHDLEITSPGPERPLTRLAHFERFVGARAKITVAEPIDGRRNFTGQLREPGAGAVAIECDGVLFQIPHDDIKRAHLVPDLPEGAAN